MLLCEWSRKVLKQKFFNQHETRLGNRAGKKMFETPKIELQEGNLGVFAHNDGYVHFVSFWNMREVDKAVEGLYGLDVEISGCEVLYFDPGFKANVRRVWVEGGGRPLQITTINFGSPDKRTIAIVVVRKGDAERTFASRMKGQSGTLALVQGPQRQPDIKGRRIGFAGSEEAQKVLAEQVMRREMDRNRREYAERMAVGRVALGPRLRVLAERRLANGLGEIRQDELNFVFVGEKNQYGGELSFPYREEWPGVSHAEELTERAIARAQFLAMVQEQIRPCMEALGMSFWEKKGNDGLFMYSVCPASVELDGYAEYFECTPASIPALTAFVDRIERAVRARSATNIKQTSVSKGFADLADLLKKDQKRQ